MAQTKTRYSDWIMEIIFIGLPITFIIMVAVFIFITTFDPSVSSDTYVGHAHKSHVTYPKLEIRDAEIKQNQNMLSEKVLALRKEKLRHVVEEERHRKESRDQERILGAKPKASVVRNDFGLVLEPPNHVDDLGEFGKGEVIHKDTLSFAQLKEYEAGFDNHRFNQYLSDRISIQRNIDDVRLEPCKTLTYPTKLPDVSVIICFHNEAMSTLLRTVYSVLNRSPQHLIREIILVDDASTQSHLQEPLENYLSPLYKVKLVRAKYREGLIRARLLGYQAAEGEVLIFLDSHCECAAGTQMKPVTVSIGTQCDLLKPTEVHVEEDEEDSESESEMDEDSDYDPSEDPNSDMSFMRLLLAALHFNENAGRPQAVTRSGVERFAIGYPKYKQGAPTVKKVLIDATYSWLEPLLTPIAQNNSMITCPIIDSIDDVTFEYMRTDDRMTSLQVGVFDWQLLFHWSPISQREQQHRKSDSDPVRSPSMPGGIFAINREFFTYLGTYDPGMEIWGGENIETSLRAWMCGGGILTIPCSHVGHIFRTSSPYTWKEGVDVLKKNSVRLAEVWLDDYKKYYYDRIHYDLGDFGDVSERHALRSSLKCHTFQWYLDNIYPEMYVPRNTSASGNIKSLSTGLCLQGPNPDPRQPPYSINLGPCSNLENQYFVMSEAGEVRRDKKCIAYIKPDHPNIGGCHSGGGNQAWQYRQDNTIFHPETGQCLEVSPDRSAIQMGECSGSNGQLWQWTRKAPLDKTLQDYEYVRQF